MAARSPETCGERHDPRQWRLPRKAWIEVSSGNGTAAPSRRAARRRVGVVQRRPAGLGDTASVATVVTVVGSRQEAELIVGMLKSYGVHAAVSADDAGRVDLALQAQGVRVLVPDSEVAQARQLLDAESAPDATLNRFQRLLVRLLGGGRNR